MVQGTTLVALAALSLIPVHGLELDVTSVDSIKSTASAISKGLVASYHGDEQGHVIGLLDDPYFFWEAGFMWDTLIQYWRLTGDDQYNDIVSQALVFQQGDNHDYAPLNQSKSLGNDDQSVWALAALSAAEARLPDPESTTWVTLAENVFNEQVLRWDPTTCGGGIRWQIYSFSNGYDYKNSGSNGNFFQLAARLARYTGNDTYSDWATKSYDWSTTIGLVDEEEWQVYDGTQTNSNCTATNHVQWSYYAGIYISGAANMYNITTGDNQKKWKIALDGFLNQTSSVFFKDGIATEVACEETGKCPVDVKAFKGLLAQTLVDTIQVAPYTAAIITPLLTSSAKAAATACGPVGTECSFLWNTTETSSRRDLRRSSAPGVSEQISALSFVQGLLVRDAAAPVTEETGGSKGGNATTTSGSGGASGSTSTSPTGSGTGTSSPSPSSTGNSGSALGVGTLEMFMAMIGVMAMLGL